MGLLHHGRLCVVNTAITAVDAGAFNCALAAHSRRLRNLGCAARAVVHAHTDLVTQHRPQHATADSTDAKAIDFWWAVQLPQMRPATTAQAQAFGSDKSWCCPCQATNSEPASG